MQEIDLRPGRFTLGRADECPFTFDDPLVSRRHAELHVGESGCLLVDLGSRNGVRVNGIRITGPTELRANDRIRLGRDELVFLQTPDHLAEPASGRRTRPTGIQESCERCGEEHASGSSYCPRCGGTLPGVPSKSPPSSSPSPAR